MFTRRALLKFVIVAMLLRVFILGPLIVVQACGIPIGGPWSPTLLSLALSQVEHTMKKFKWVAIRTLFPSLSKKFGDALLVKRYVDDVLALSRCVCDGCLRVLQRLMYDGVLIFDEDFEAVQRCNRTVGVKFLDVFFTWDGTRISFFQSIKNLSMLINESLETRKQFRFPLFLGVSCPEQLRKISVELSGRRARWSQLGLRANQYSLALAITYDLLELRMHAFPMAFILAIWHAQRGDQQDREIALRLIPTIFDKHTTKSYLQRHLDYLRHLGPKVSAPLTLQLQELVPAPPPFAHQELAITPRRPPLDEFEPVSYTHLTLPTKRIV